MTNNYTKLLTPKVRNESGVVAHTGERITRRLRQENLKFWTTPGYMTRKHLKEQNKGFNVAQLIESSMYKASST